ncbi:MAG: hypothetical protein N3A63_02245 [Bacteroidetes bacterium]|nr:hypothetical protein [Bacteroidota bacterium]
MKFSHLLFIGMVIPMVPMISHAKQSLPWMNSTLSALSRELTEQYGTQQQQRIQRGLEQVARYWTTEDGDSIVFINFVRKYFAGTPEVLDTLFSKCEFYLEPLFGYMEEITRKLREHIELDRGPITPIDELFGSYAPNAHITEDFFRNKIAFAVLLNFPLTTVEERLNNGLSWTRRQWAEVRLAQLFAYRIPATAYQALAEAASIADQYISEYNIFMHHVLDEQGERPFPPGMRLLSHWNLRDELKAQYSSPKGGIAKQRLIQKIMERIVTQTIPASVINNPTVDWNPFTNTVTPTKVFDVPQSSIAVVQSTFEREPDTRYAMLLKTFQAARGLDPYCPLAPSHMARRFNEEREIPELYVRYLLESILSSPVVPRVAKLIEHRLQRPLEPFDIWYNGFKPQSKFTQEELDQRVQQKYPSLDAFTTDVPNILITLGFDESTAHTIASHLTVEAARGAGHAAGAAMRTAKARLRTRVGSNGMNYKSFNIAMHELGHNVEQILSLNKIDFYFLNGVPNVAFTEAIAFLFQSRDLEILGLQNNDPIADALFTLNDFWATYEIAGVALVDMDVWRWMYEHPTATPEELREATLAIARKIWNTYYAPIFNRRDIELLAIYSHLIDAFLYLPDYPLGHIIAHQIEEYISKHPPFGKQIVRMVTFGKLSPQLWMKHATGQELSVKPFIQATENALKYFE